MGDGPTDSIIDMRLPDQVNPILFTAKPKGTRENSTWEYEGLGQLGSWSPLFVRKHPRNKLTGYGTYLKEVEGLHGKPGYDL